MISISIIPMNIYIFSSFRKISLNALIKTPFFCGGRTLRFGAVGSRRNTAFKLFLSSILLTVFCFPRLMLTAFRHLPRCAERYFTITLFLLTSPVAAVASMK